ncbi:MULTISPECIES: hypothetical protein [Brevibacillus]|uniref:hypothetical protein n=1 Tax=Brevibacillus TaxID=55080 RepID=UPI00068A1C95|nr:hypothetical protein [Brevibacillus borstelensis]
MSVINHEELTVTFQKNEYRFTKVGIDISKEFDKPTGTVIMTHEIEGFEVPLYMIEEKEDEQNIGFSFGVKVGQTGLFVTLEDENIRQKATELVFYVVEREGWE